MFTRREMMLSSVAVPVSLAVSEIEKKEKYKCPKIYKLEKSESNLRKDWYAPIEWDDIKRGDKLRIILFTEKYIQITDVVAGDPPDLSKGVSSFEVMSRDYEDLKVEL